MTPASQLDRSSPMPLWAQLEADLQRRLDADEFHERFPTDQELVEQYEVSRHTVREAVRHLNRTGVLRRERGRGTVVKRAEFEQSLGALYSLFWSIESVGVEQRSEVLELATVIDPTVSVHLELEPDTELVYLERLRFAGDTPLAVDRAWLPAEIASPLLQVDFSHTALYDELDAAGIKRPTEGWERISPVVPSPHDRERLGLSESAVAFFLERLGRRGNQVLEWRTTIIRGDRYRFVADWSHDSASSLRLSPWA